MLRTNKAGAYASTTIIDCNTRKYHGLFVVPVPNLGIENYVLLSSLDETVIQHGAEFNPASTNIKATTIARAGTNTFANSSTRLLVPFTARWRGAAKERTLCHESRMLIRYTLLDNTFGNNFAV